MKIDPYKIRLTVAGIVLLLSILAVCGLFYPVKFMDIQFTPLLQRTVCDFSILAVCLSSGILLFTLLFGRFYCSIICPFGILQEFIALLRSKRKNTIHGNFGFKYLIAGLTFGALVGGSALFIRYIEPYTIFGSVFSLTIFGIIVTILVLVLVFFKNRFFCTNICPVGAVLGLIAKLSTNKIYINKEKCVSCSMCANSCPSGCIDYKEKNVNNETCIKCLKCLTICKKDAVKYGIQPIKFSTKRRDLLWGIGALVFLSAGYAAGLKFTKNLAKKVQDIILPPGAVNTSRMANKCLNCNLCINNCPNKILSKASDKFPAVHIDYSKGKGYCEYNCYKCSEVCPTAAIKKLTLEEKQNTRIGMAMITEGCIGCGKCSWVCPTSAIKWEAGNKAVVDGSKCIGCGKCATTCKPKAINIYSVTEQNFI